MEGQNMKFMFGLQHPLTCKPWTTLSNPCNKLRGKYNCKEVFLCLPSCVVYSCVCLWCCVVLMLNERVNNYITYISWLTVVDGDLKAPLSIATAPWCRGRRFSFSWISPLTLIRSLDVGCFTRSYQVPFLFYFRYDSIWDWNTENRNIYPL